MRGINGYTSITVPTCFVRSAGMCRGIRCEQQPLLGLSFLLPCWFGPSPNCKTTLFDDKSTGRIVHEATGRVCDASSPAKPLQLRGRVDLENAKLSATATRMVLLRIEKMKTWMGTRVRRARKGRMASAHLRRQRRRRERRTKMTRKRKRRRKKRRKRRRNARRTSSATPMPMK